MSAATDIKEVADLILSIDDELGLDSIDEALALVDARDRRTAEYLRKATWQITALAVVVQEQQCLQCGSSHQHVVGTYVREQREIDNGRAFRRLQHYKEAPLKLNTIPRVVERLETE